MSGLSTVAGTFYAQKYLYIDPNIAFGIDKSVEMLLVTMVGGAGNCGATVDFHFTSLS